MKAKYNFSYIKNKFIFILIFGIFLSGIVGAMSPQQLDQQTPYNCTNETNPLAIKIIELNITLNETITNLTYYMNLSEYYKNLYESKEVNVTHRELIQILNSLNTYNYYLNQTNNTLNDIKNKFSIFTFEVGISILGVTGISVGLIELTLWYFKKRRKEKNETKS